MTDTAVTKETFGLLDARLPAHWLLAIDVIAESRRTGIYPHRDSYDSFRGGFVVAHLSIRSSQPISPSRYGHHAEDVATAAAVRLISETSHDLRSPLTAVRESIRFVRDRDLGPINEDQYHLLDLALKQCDCMEQMVGEMVQLDRLRTGIPRVHRQCVSVVEIRRLVDDALRPWTEPRRINVLWDGADDPQLTVFADPSMLRRLLVNLATNAIRASAEGSFVLIRLASIHHGQVVRWSVVDRGRGIRESEICRAADGQASFADGEGLGLAISRQLAALQFSMLKIRSRLGKGTEVSFETSASGPQSLASVWTRWRQAFRNDPETVTPSRSKANERVSRIGDRQIRLDAPVVSLSLSHNASRPRCTDLFAAGVVSLGATVSRSVAEQFDAAIQSQLLLYDLAYRVNTRRWIWCLDADQDSLQERIDSITDQLRSRIPGIRMTWSRPHFISLASLGAPSQVTELFVRQTLAGAPATHAWDSDQMRLDITPIEPSPIASERLDAEIQRLKSGLRASSLTAGRSNSA